MVLSMTRKVTMDDEVVAQVFRQPSRSSFSSVSNNFQFLGLDLRKYKSATKNAKMYDEDGLTGGHAIMLGADSLSKAAAIEALHAYPDGSMYVFNNEQMDLERLKDLVSVVGKDRLVLNLSCIKREGKYAIVTDRWQKFIDVYLDEEILDFLANYADEFLVYGVHVEGQKYYVKSHVRINI
ncbi:hypothetical protein GBA52_003433 [Prunus armeniaca]|nr:hypothetical protein GBA52_003433 [Prunus armeniaca]